MRRRFLLFLIFFVAFAFLPEKTSAAIEAFKFKGLTATSTFFGTDPNDACISTYTSVWATEGRIKEGAGAPSEISEAHISLWRYNSCTVEDLLQASGTAALPAEAFAGDKKLNSATLNTTVELCDAAEGCFPASIQLTWTGTGEILKDKFKSVNDFGRCKTRYEWKGSTRSAVAMGSVMALGMEWTPQPATYAYLVFAQEGNASINCE